MGAESETPLGKRLKGRADLIDDGAPDVLGHVVVVVVVLAVV